MLNSKKTLIFILLSLLISGCAVQQLSKPLDRTLASAKLTAKDPTSPAFKAYLLKHGYVEENLPISEWDADDLTLCALFYHSRLDVARKQLALSSLAIQTAGVKSSPTINGSLAHSNLKNDDLKPWAYGLSLDIPVETNNKRKLRIEKAESNADVIHMDIAEIAWQLRHQITTDLIAYHQNLAETQLLEQELETQTNILKMLEKRVQAGLASGTELSASNLLALKTKHSLNNNRSEFSAIKAKLAADVGLSIEKFELISIKPLSMENVLTEQSEKLDGSFESKVLQEQALLNRIDIRRSIARYAAAEAEIRIQAAQQIPDITLSPGILFEFGDKIWSLGFSSLLNVLNKNTALIEEAKQLREIEGAEFEHLQASTIAQTNQAHTNYLAVKQNLTQTKSELTDQQAQAQKMEKQFQAGLIGKLDVETYSLNTLLAKQHFLAAQFELLKIANDIENIMQKPLYTAFEMPTLTIDEVRQ